MVLKVFSNLSDSMILQDLLKQWHVVAKNDFSLAQEERHK